MGREPEKMEKTKTPGIYRRHRRSCSGGQKCGCPYLATVYSKREKKLIRRQFDGIGEARTWRQDAGAAVKAGKLKAPTRETVAQAAAVLIEGMQSGAIFDRGGRTYKPSTVRSYETALRRHILPRLGHRRLSDIDHGDLQGLVEEMHAAGLSASTITNTLDPLRVIFRRARRRIPVDPTEGLDMPAKNGKRRGFAGQDRAAKLIEALPADQQAYWSTAFYAGLRRGELRGLRWTDIDVKGGVIHVRRGWDDVEGPIDPKSDAGARIVPLVGSLKKTLAAHKLATGRSGDDLVFGRSATLPFVPSTVNARAYRVWKAAGLDRLTSHEARHSCASYLIASGACRSDFELAAYIGHSDARTTKAIYGHMLPGHEREAAERLTAFLSGKDRESERRGGAVP